MVPASLPTLVCAAASRQAVFCPTRLAVPTPKLRHLI
jgi:hypothetical protein